MYIIMIIELVELGVWWTMFVCFSPPHQYRGIKMEKQKTKTKNKNKQKALDWNLDYSSYFNSFVIKSIFWYDMIF